VALRGGLDRCEKSRPHRDSTPDLLAHRQSLYRLRYPAQEELNDLIRDLDLPKSKAELLG